MNCEEAMAGIYLISVKILERKCIYQIYGTAVRGTNLGSPKKLNLLILVLNLQRHAESPNLGFMGCYKRRIFYSALTCLDNDQYSVIDLVKWGTLQNY